MQLQRIIFASILAATVSSLPVSKSRRTSSCAWPENTGRYAVITRDDAELAAHEVYSAVHVGGSLSSSSSTSVSIASHNLQLSYVGGTSSPTGSWNIKCGQTNQNTLSFGDFETLAASVVDSTSDGYKVVTVNQGGSYSSSSSDCAVTVSTEDYRGQDGQGEDNGKTLVVYKDAGTVCLDKTASGRQFGPTILAPLAHVVIIDDVGFVDGTIIARSVSSPDSHSGVVNSNNQLHGDIYAGAICCDTGCGQPIISTTSESSCTPATAAPSLSPSAAPSAFPTVSNSPTTAPTETTSPSTSPSGSPSEAPSAIPTTTQDQCDRAQDNEGCLFYHYDIQMSAPWERSEVLNENCQAMVDVGLECPVTCDISCYSDGNGDGSGSGMQDLVEVNVESLLIFDLEPTQQQQSEIMQACVDQLTDTFQTATAWTCAIEKQADVARRAAVSYTLAARGFSAQPDEFLAESASETGNSFSDSLQTRLEAGGLPKPTVEEFKVSLATETESSDSSSIDWNIWGYFIAGFAVALVFVVGSVFAYRSANSCQAKARLQASSVEFKEPRASEAKRSSITVTEKEEAPLSPSKNTQAPGSWFSGTTEL